MAKELSGEVRLFDPMYMLKNVVVSFVATAILLLVAAILVTYLSATESVIDAAVLVVTAFCVRWGGFRAARHLGKQGLLCGAISGLIYVAVLYLFGSLIFGELSFHSQTLLSMALSVGCGAIGGIVGVNTGKRRRR